MADQEIQYDWHRVYEARTMGLKFLRDGELKLVSRSIRELRYALKVFRPYQETSKISIWRSWAVRQI